MDKATWQSVTKVIVNGLGFGDYKWMKSEDVMEEQRKYVLMSVVDQCSLIIKGNPNVLTPLSFAADFAGMYECLICFSCGVSCKMPKRQRFSPDMMAHSVANVKFYVSHIVVLRKAPNHILGTSRSFMMRNKGYAMANRSNFTKS